MLHGVDPFAAFAGGLLSFISPCVLAVVPGYVAYLGGASVEKQAGRAGLVINGAFFVAGFSLVFILLFSVVKLFLIQLSPDYQRLLTQVGAVLVVLLGLQFLGLFRMPFLFREARLQLAHRLRGGSPVSALVVGMTFGLGWTPCIGPILTFIILRASEQDFVHGFGLMLVYCAGVAIPFLAVAALLQRARPVMRAINARGRLVEATSGGLLVVVGLLMFAGQFAVISQQLGRLAPYLPTGG